MTCHSNFCSLYDCRNFIKEVSSYSKQGNFNFYNIITKDIPDLVRHCIDNAKNKIYNVFGEYKLNRLYVINDFVLNANNHLFKAKNKKKETVYLITTEIALLVLQQYKKEDWEWYFKWLTPDKAEKFGSINANYYIRTPLSDSFLLFSRYLLKKEHFLLTANSTIPY